MAKLIISGDFVDLGIITSLTEDVSYPDDNVEDLWHLKKRFRATNAATDTWLLKFNFGSAQSVEGVLLNDVNFDKVKIEGHASDAWGTPDYVGTEYAVSRDEVVDRYKIYIPITGFNLQWMRIYIPGTAATVGDYKGKWETGTVVVADSVTELSRNMSFGYKRSSDKPYEALHLPHGGSERASLGDDLAWVGHVIFGRRTETTEESDLWAINNYDIANPLILYENRGNTSRAYLCLRDDAYEGSLVANNSVIGNMVRFKELV